MDKFEVGKKYKTRGGWEAEIVWIRKTHVPNYIIAIHFTNNTETIAQHDKNGNGWFDDRGVCVEKSGYDLISLVEEGQYQQVQCVCGKTGDTFTLRICNKNPANHCQECHDAETQQPKILKVEVGKTYKTETPETLKLNANCKTCNIDTFTSGKATRRAIFISWRETYCLKCWAPRASVDIGSIKEEDKVFVEMKKTMTGQKSTQEIEIPRCTCPAEYLSIKHYKNCSRSKK